MVEFKRESEELERILLNESKLAFGYREPLMDVKNEIFFGSGNGITGIEKFLGYNDAKQNVANFPSISLTHDFVTVEAAVRISEKDRIFVDGREDQNHARRAIKALDIFREMFGLKEHFAFYLRRHKKYEKAKGMGESAAFASATSYALCSLAFKNPNPDIVSAVARLVSGSGSRAAVYGVGLWLSYEGIDSHRNHAVRVKEDLGQYKIAAFPRESAIKTENMHGLATDSLFYNSWAKNKFNEITNLIRNNFKPELLAERSMKDMLLMHSVLMSQGIRILDRKMFDLIDLSKGSNGSLYVTADTGPTPVLLYSDEELLKKAEYVMGSKSVKGNLVNQPIAITSDFQKEAENGLLKNP